MSAPILRERMLGALWGALAGDALGVPVEFMSRATVRQNPVCGMRGFGTHRQPAGTWSDDSSLLLCAAESLVERDGFDSADLAQRFIAWERVGVWTPYGEVFDIGIATAQAIGRLRSGVAPESAGGADDYSNGNGSLMRILPMALWYHERPAAELAALVQRASSLTHRHPRAQMACVFYCLIVQALLGGAAPNAAYDVARKAFAVLYETPPFVQERDRFQALEKGRLRFFADEEIESSGYVMHTLTASIWCLLTSFSFEDAVLKAVNLGGDTDTTGTVTGGLAGTHFGLSAMPSNWRTTLARHEEITELFTRLVEAIPAADGPDATT